MNSLEEILTFSIACLDTLLYRQLDSFPCLYSQEMNMHRQKQRDVVVDDSMGFASISFFTSLEESCNIYRMAFRQIEIRNSYCIL
jgi:hypothetical protein